MAASSIADVVRAVADGVADQAIVPVENLTAGSIEATASALADFPAVVIERELTLAVQFHLLAVEGSEIGAIRRVLSFPQATAQCRRFLEARLPAAEIETADSTASSARRVAERGSKDTAAIASARAAELYGLEILARSIEDEPENWTRFAVLGLARSNGT